MTDWVAQDDWSLLKLHDLVRVTRDDGMLTGEIVSIGMNGHGRIVLSAIGTYTSIEINLRDWQLSVQAKPAVELPTEVGYYLNTHSELAVRQINGSWRNDRDITIGPMEMEARAPYKKLEPVAVTAMKVLEDVSRFAWADGFMPQLRELSNKYGVTDD